jgi:hypothetical protein
MEQNDHLSPGLAFRVPTFFSIFPFFRSLARSTLFFPFIHETIVLSDLNAILIVEQTGQIVVLQDELTNVTFHSSTYHLRLQTNASRFGLRTNFHFDLAHQRICLAIQLIRNPR